MSEMVERVARAMVAQMPERWDQLSESARRGMLAYARAAIEAMREHKVVVRMNGEVVNEIRGEPNEIWRMFLDDALNEQPDPPASRPASRS